MTGFAIGDRVLYCTDPSDSIDTDEAAGEIVATVRRIALIRPDDSAVSGVIFTTRHMRDITKET